MIEKISYYLLVYPLSLLPLPLLYLLSDLFYLLLRTVVPYRKKVVQENLKKSFPNLNASELKKIERNFYRHFSNLLAESVKNLSIRKLNLKKRIEIVNRDLLDQLFIQGKSVVIVGAHYGNWEWMISGLNFLFAHQSIGIGTPMTSAFFDKKINARRARFGMKIVHAKNFKNHLKENQETPVSLLMLSDQSPPNSEKSFWTNFLNRPTACFFGAEMIAHEHDFAVVYMHQKKTKRGYYSIQFESIAYEPKDYKWGEITEKHVRCLEREIIEAPEFWMWSHKRWKRKVPENLESLKEQQRKKFNEKFNY
ncbi:MAG: lysophospholipid acyltransferase family protein [Bacteroidetes bacterium]|nr:lysophospholipid acyltransferase family protein [Bacteroidota bacterium]